MPLSERELSPRRLYIDLAPQESEHRQEWETRLASWRQDSVVLTDDPSQADWILRTAAPQLGAPISQPKFLPGREFVWDYGDQPFGENPGLYASLPRQRYHRRQHRTFCYPLIYNECIEHFDTADASHLIGFVGGITSALRARLVAALKDASSAEVWLQVSGGPWNAMFDRSGLAVKSSYAQALRNSKFFLCPRGNGVSSVRLFETMQAGRVPVIVSDAYVLPENIDWNRCALIVKENALARLPDIVRERASDWPQMAVAARHAWETNFGNEHLLKSIGGHLSALSSQAGQFRGVVELNQRRRLAQARLEWWLRQLYFRVRH